MLLFRSRSPPRNGAGAGAQADTRVPQNGNAHPSHAFDGRDGGRNGRNDDRRLHDARQRDEAERREGGGGDSDRYQHHNGGADRRQIGDERSDRNGRSRDSDRRDSDRHHEHRSGDRHKEDGRRRDRERHGHENGHGKAHRHADEDRQDGDGETAAPREATVYRGGGASAQGADTRYGLSYGADGEDRFGDRRSALTFICQLHFRPAASRCTSCRHRAHTRSAFLPECVLALAPSMGWLAAWLRHCRTA